MLAWIKKVLGKGEVPIEDRVPHPSAWPVVTVRDQARVQRLIEAIREHKQRFPGQVTDKLTGLREELARRLNMEA